MYRSIDTEVWNDGWFQEELNRDQKLLFLFLITNQRTTTTGAFEITLSSLSTETGIPRDELPALLASLAPKIVWWPEHRIAWVRNFHRRQFPNANEKIITNARGVLARMPAEVVDTVCAEYPSLSDPSAYPTDRVSIPPSIEEKSIDTDTATERETGTGEDVPRSHAAAASVDPALVESVVSTLWGASFISDEPDDIRVAVVDAFERVHTFDPRDGPLEAAQFVAWFTTGKGKRKQPTDWIAAYRNWLKNAVKFEARDIRSAPTLLRNGNGRIREPDFTGIDTFTAELERQGIG